MERRSDLIEQPLVVQHAHQASAVPYRINAKGKLQFCLITSTAGRWKFPKGLIDPGETATEAALKEAFEEAGIRGIVDETPLGYYQITKRGQELTVVALLMAVHKTVKEWPEADSRKRRWTNLETARELVSEDHVQELLTAALQRLNGHVS